MSSFMRYALGAAALAASLWGTQASAQDANVIDPGTVPAASRLYLSGSTALDNLLKGQARILPATAAYCDETGNFSKIAYFVSSDGNQVVITCTGAPNTANAGNPILIAKESELGSGNGVIPVGTPTTSNSAYLPFLNVDGAGFACTGSGGVGVWVNGNAAGTVSDPNLFPAKAGVFVAAEGFENCGPQTPANTTGILAQAGVADVNSALIPGASATIQAGLTQIPQIQTIFGIPVTLGLFRALQAAYLPPACFGVDTPACTPSLPSAVLAQAMSVTNSNLDKLLTCPNNPTVGFSACLTAAGHANLIPPADAVSAALGIPNDTITHWCRRDQYSGTTITTQVVFLNQGCGGSDQFVKPTGGNASCITTGCSYTNGDTEIVFAGKSSGNVRNCLNDKTAQQIWAFGILSTDNDITNTLSYGAPPVACPVTSGDLNDSGGAGPGVPPYTGHDALGAGGKECMTQRYRFIRIDGGLPSVEVAANGGYLDVTEDMCTQRTAANGATLAGVGLATFNLICNTPGSGLTHPANVIAADAAWVNEPWGNGGFLERPQGNTVNTSPITLNGGGGTSSIIANPVNSFTRSASGTYNNCSKLQVLSPNSAVANPSGGPNAGPGYP